MSLKAVEVYDYLAKVLIIGDSGVGKTCLLLRFCDNNFSSSHLPTIGIDYKSKILEADDKRIKMQIWDTAGQEKFRTITQTYFKGASGIIVTYAIDDRSSFQNVDSWIRQIGNNLASENVCLVLVGTKCDSAKRTVTTAEGQKFADSYNMAFFETSALEDVNINEVFASLASSIKAEFSRKSNSKAIDASEANTNKKLQTVLGSGNEIQKEKGCCS